MAHRVEAFIAVCFTGVACVLLAQSNAVQAEKTIRIGGRVVDVNTMPLQGTRVALKSAGSTTPTLAVLADEAGEFSLTLQPSLSYELQFYEPGFKSVTMRLAKGAFQRDTQLGTLVLQIGEVTEGPMYPIKPPKQVKPFTVCEVLADLKRFDGKAIAVAGKLECTWSLIDHTCHLVEDRCTRPIITQGSGWRNRILLWDTWEAGMPKPPTDDPEIENSWAMEKLLSMRTTTFLGFHKEPLFKAQDGSVTFSHDVKDTWGAAYGRLSVTPPSKKDDFEGTPATLITKPDVLRTYSDERVDSYPIKR